MEPNIDKAKILDRIRKMLALAKDNGASEGERDNALRMAHATIAKYNLDINEVESSGIGPKENRTKEHTEFFGRPWARQIASGVGKLLFCHYYFQIPGHTRSATKVQHHYTGRESNVVTACELAKFLVNSILSERKKREAQLDEWEREAFARSFAWGASQRIRERIEDIIAGRDPSAKIGTGKELVLASLYKTEAEKNAVALKEMGIKLTTSKSQGRRSRNLDGLGEGRTYGNSLSLSPQITKTKQERLR